MEFSAKDVLDKALGLIRIGPLPGSNCSDFCPWCAIAIAKTELDSEFHTELDPLTAAIYFYNELPGDGPLIEARKALARFKSEDVIDLSYERARFILSEGLC